MLQMMRLTVVLRSPQEQVGAPVVETPTPLCWKIPCDNISFKAVGELHPVLPRFLLHALTRLWLRFGGR